MRRDWPVSGLCHTLPHPTLPCLTLPCRRRRRCWGRRPCQSDCGCIATGLCQACVRPCRTPHCHTSPYPGSGDGDRTDTGLCQAVPGTLPHPTLPYLTLPGLRRRGLGLRRQQPAGRGDRSRDRRDPSRPAFRSLPPATAHPHPSPELCQVFSSYVFRC